MPGPRTAVIVALVALLAAGCGDDGDAGPSGSSTAPPPELGSEDLRAALPSRAELPDGWVVDPPGDDDGRPELCPALDERPDLDELGLPHAEVAYESPGGGFTRGATLTAFATPDDARARVDESVEIAESPECKELRFDWEGVGFLATREVTPVDAPGFSALHLTLRLDRDFQGTPAGTVVLEQIDAGTLIGRCFATFAITDLTPDPAPPTDAEIRAWARPTVERVEDLEGCDAADATA